MINIGLLGFGTVAGAFYDLVEENKETLEKLTGQEIKFKKILVRNPEKYDRCQVLLTTDPDQIFADEKINLIVEATGEIENLFKPLEAALKKGVNIISANKALVSKYLKELLPASEIGQAQLKFEGAVGGAIPLLSQIEKLKAAGGVKSVTGVLNGTSNFILNQMEEGLSFEDALQLAKDKGYAEADPSADIDGIDTQRKLNILASLLFDQPFDEEKIPTTGIRNISETEIKSALEKNKTIKLLAYGDKDGNFSVRPEKVDRTSIIGSLAGGENAVVIETINAGEIVIKAPGAGGRETAYSLVSDLIDIYSK